LCLMLRDRPRQHPLAQRRAGDVGHRVVGNAADVARGQKRYYMRMLKPRCELDLAFESFRRERGADVGGKHLDDHFAAEPGFLGQEDMRHPTATELALDSKGVAKRSLEVVPEL